MKNPWIIDGRQLASDGDIGTQLALELALSSLSAAQIAATQTQIHYPTPGHTSTFVWGKGAYFSPSVVTGDDTLLTFGFGEITCVTAGAYQFNFPAIKLHDTSHGVLSAVRVYVKQSGAQSYVPYIVAIGTMSSEKQFDGNYEVTPASSFIMELEAGDSVKIGSTFRNYHSYGSANLGGATRAHRGAARHMVDVGDPAGTIKIFKI